MVKISDVPSKYNEQSFAYFLDRALHKILEADQEVNSRNIKKVIQTLCSISEALIWSEQNHMNLFE